MRESIWKKEIRLRKKPEPLPPLPAHLLERSRIRVERPAGTVVVPVVPASDPLQRVERWTSRVPAPSVEKPATVEFPKPAAGEGQDPVALLPARATVDPAPVTPELPEPASAYGWPKHEEQTEPPAEAVASVPQPEIVVPVPEPVSDTELPDGPSQPEVVASVSEPVSESEAPESVSEPEAPEPAPEKVPLLKRELTFKRKSKPAKQPKAKKEKPEKPVAEKKPLLKRELGLKRAPKAPTEPKPPRAKRQLHFPKPQQRAKARSGHKIQHVVGLRIGSSQLSAACIENNGHAELVQLAHSPIERGLVAGGEVRDAAALTKALKEFFVVNKLPRKDVRLGIASNRIGVRVLEVPGVSDPKQFDNALRFRAQEVLPIPVTDAILDHVVLGESVNSEGDVMRRVLLVFAHRELVTRYVDVCRNAGVRLAGIDLDAFALLRAVGARSDGSNAVVAVAIGHERTILAVSDGAVCDFTRVLEWGGSSLDVAIARALNLTPSQAEPVRQRLALDGDDVGEGLTPVELEAVRSAVRAEIGVLGRELVSSLRFYQSRSDSLAIAEVLLTGGAAQLGGLPSELHRLLGAPVRVADPFEHVTVGKRVEPPAESGSLAIAVGLGIEV